MTTLNPNRPRFAWGWSARGSVEIAFHKDRGDLSPPSPPSGARTPARTVCVPGFWRSCLSHVP